MKARLTGLLDVALDLAKEALGVTQLQAKLGACSDACKLSEDAEPLKPGDPAWSHAYEDVADLRRDWLREVGISNQQSAEMTRLGCELARANNEVCRLSKCAAEHEKKSNDRRLELAAIAQALGCPAVKEKMLERIAELRADKVNVNPFKAFDMTPSEYAKALDADNKVDQPKSWLTRPENTPPNSNIKVVFNDGKVPAPLWSDWVLEPCLEASHGSMRPVWVHTRHRRGDGLIMQAGPAGWVVSSRHRGSATDIDDAREKADAHLVSIGELEAKRAFNRIGEWEPDGTRMTRQGVVGTGPMALMDYSGSAIWDCGKWFFCGTATGDAGKEAADAELVKRGLLDPSRAFKVANVTPAPSPLGDWNCPDKAREAADASLVGQGRLEPSRAFERLGGWDEFVDGMWVRSSTRNAIRVNRVGGWEVFAVLGGRPVLIAAGQETCDAGKEAVDALLARHGLLDPSRAFKVRRAVPFTLENVQNAAEKLRAASAPKCNALGEPDDAGTFYAANQGLPAQGPFVDLGKGGAK